MKTINSFRSKLFAFTLALMASVSTFAYDFVFANDFHIDGFGYKIISNNEPRTVGLMEIADCTEDVVIPATVTYNGLQYIVSTVGMGGSIITNDARITIKSIFIPKTIQVVNMRALSDCPHLCSIVVDEENPYLDSRNDCNAIVTSKDLGSPANTLIAGCQTTTIPNSVTEIGDYAFYRCDSLKHMTVPNGVTTINNGAFSECSSLSSIKLPESITQLPQQWIFSGCTNLKEVFFFAKTPPYIAYGMFRGLNPTIFVPKESLDAYKKALYWQDFDIQAIPYKSKWCDTWNILSHGQESNPNHPFPHARTSIYWLSENTINRNGYEYIPLMCSSSKPNVESTHLVGELRFAEDKQVYFYYDNTEYLLYDFGAQVGDQLQIFSGIDNYNRYKTYTHVVTRREYLEDGRIKLTSIPFFDEPVPDVIDENYYLSVTWIEGVGSEHGIVHNNINYIPGMGTDWLLCAYRDGECRYTTDDPEYAPLGCVYNDGDFIEDAFPILSGLQRTVCNEYCGDTEDDNSANNTYKQTFDSIFFENNKPYILCNDYLLREEDNKILIYSQLLNKDLVLYDFTLEVGDSLPALYIYYHARNAMDWIPYNLDVVDYNKDFDGTIYPADTFVVTDISNVTLLDGKEYKKWTFDNGMEYVEGIGMYGGHRNGNFFGLIQEVVVPCHIGTHLVCASRNGKLLYQMDDAEMERLGAECLCEVEPSYKSQWCNTWNVFTHSGGARLDSEETWQYKLDRDTIINGKLYSTVIYYLTSDPSREYYMGAVRFGDDRKVYRAIGNSESVVYDFTAQVGDTLGPGVVYDVEVDSLTNLKTIYFHPYDRYEDKYIEYATVKWIEGVGSTDGFLLAKDYGTVGGASFYLLCAYRDDELKYAANKDLGCRYNAGEVTHDHFPTLAGLSRTIHEERNTNDTTRRDDFTKVVLDRSFPTLYHSQMYLRERDNKIFVVSRTYKNLTELYEYVLYDFTLEVGDSLPMLYIDYSSRGDWGPTYPLSILNVVNYRKEADGTIYPGDTLIVTEVSTITLLDGKEYKKWTFNNGMEYAEGIGSLSGDFYELIANKRTTEDLTASQLVCASQNGQLLYQMDDTEMERLGTECLCDYTSGPKKDNAKDGQIGGRPTPTQWNMLEMELRKMENGVTILQAETFSYTLEDISQQVNNKTYFQLARQSTKDTATTKSVVGALHFGKDEDNRVYFLRDGVEYVLYDFTAEPGDTVEIFAGVNNYPQETTYTHVVTGKDTLENGACRMILEVVFPDETTTAENAEKVWLAGLGSIDGIVHNAASRASNARSSETQTSVMLCAWRDDDCLYTTDHPDYDTLGCVYNTESTGVGNTTSSTSYQKILRNGHLLILHQGRIYNVMGVEIK